MEGRLEAGQARGPGGNPRPGSTSSLHRKYTPRRYAFTRIKSKISESQPCLVYHTKSYLTEQVLRVISSRIFRRNWNFTDRISRIFLNKLLV